MIYLWGFSPKRIIAILSGGCVVLPFVIGLLKEYQRSRLLVFLNPNLDPLGSGYTITQSKISIGSGGLWGKGFMAGTQNYLKFLPERHTDFIFGVIAEEGGFIICFLLIGLFWLIIARGYRIAGQTSDRFGAQLACGITTMIAVQVFINLGMTMGILPVVGVPLPLVSYGGTSVAITLASIGILLSIKNHRSLF
jgi:rod shape determining protein RodA